MEILWPKPGKYIVAVSGGVDSVVLLHRLAVRSSQFAVLPTDRLVRNNLESTNDQPNNEKSMKGEKRKIKNRYELIVAHVDHGWRTDSSDDERFVRELAQKYKLNYVSTKLTLPKKSEAAARAGRWEFLHDLRVKHDATAIITAHHADDIAETILINLQRGTGRSGLTSLKETLHIKRPLLNVTKNQIYEYCVAHNIEFVEDSTNKDNTYTRNAIRAKLGRAQNTSKKLQKIYSRMLTINAEIDELLGGIEKAVSDKQGARINVDRQAFSSLDQKIQHELLRFLVLRLNSDAELNTEQITRGADSINASLPSKITELGSRIELKHQKQISSIVRISTPRMEVLK